MFRSFMFSFLLLLAVPAFAAKVAIVDFQRAVAETTEGKAAEKRLQDGMNIRRAEIARQKTELERLYKDFEARQLILNDEARKKAIEELQTKEAKLQQDAMRFEQEMQQEYLEIVSELDAKMRDLSAKIAKEKGYDLVLDQSAVIYSGGEVVDMTPELIRRYNAK